MRSSHPLVRTLFVLSALLSAEMVAAQPTPDSLRAITERGRLLAQYDYAAWHGTDAIVPLVKDEGLVRGYVARKTSDGWLVSFGRLSAASDTFYVAFEALELPAKPDSFRVTAFPNRKVDTDYLASAERAIELARSDFGPVKRSYNLSALPTENGEWWVYVMPAQTYSNVWPLGGDARYRISHDGRTILVKRRLHNVVLDVRLPDSTGGKKLINTVHSAVLDTIPEDTDVFHVLTRGFRAPEMVATDKYIYRIETDGTIRLIAR
jgi:hypothetical protein